MRLEIDLSRCICIHSFSQAIDITLQVLLYQRQIIPEPVQFLLTSNNEHKANKFKNAYNDVQRVIQQSFCHRNSCSLKEFVIVIGNTPYLPKEIYRIPVTICLKHLIPFKDCSMISIDNKNNEICNDNNKTEDYNNLGCGDHCACLTQREKRQIFSSLALNKTVQNLLKNSVLCANDKVFFFMSTNSASFFSNLNGLEEDDGFELPSKELRKRRNIRQVTVQIKPIACSLNADYKLETTFQSIVNTPITKMSKVASPKSASTIHSSQRHPLRNKKILSCSFNGSVTTDCSLDNLYDSSIQENDENLWYRVMQYFVRII